MAVESMWQPSASIEILRQRAAFLAQIRTFFTKRQYLEVETPIMAHHGGTDVYLTNIKAFFRNQAYSLQTSPEYHMKRLLAAGSGPIFQLARVFRDDELGSWHNPEFTMLEWYQLNIDHHALMDEMDSFLQEMLQCQPLLRKTYCDAFIAACHIDPLQASITDLQAVLARHNLALVLDPNEHDRDQYLFLLMSHVVEPFWAKESRPVAVYDFPPSQSALARVEHGVALRFEIYYKGVELANGFYELTDSGAQAQRFAEDLRVRAEKGLEQPKPDIWLLQALKYGLPSCSGVALGVDRLLALSLDKDRIAEVLSFDFSRA